MQKGKSSSGDRPESAPALLVHDVQVPASQLWSMPAAFVLSAPATGEVYAVNPAFEQMTGFSSAELVGHTTLEIGLFVTPADREAVVGKAGPGGVVDQQEIDIRTRSGRIRTVLASCHRFWAGDRELMCSLFMDVTARHEAERALERSEERYRLLFNEGTEPAMVLEASPGSTIARVVEVNDRAVEMLERPRHELLRMSPHEWEAPDNAVPLARLVAALEERGQFTTERHAVTPAGRRLILEVRARRIAWAGYGHPQALVTARDLTAQRQAEAELRLNEASLRVALQAANIRLFRTDRDLRVNWSFSPEEGAALRFQDDQGQLRPAVTNGRSRIGSALRRVVATGETVRLDVHLHRKAEVRMHEMLMEPARDAAGAVSGVAVAVFDIEARKAAELELRSAARRFELLTEAAPMGIFQTDAEGVVTHANAAAKRIIGRSLEAPVPVQNIALAEDYWMTAARWSALRRGEISGPKEIRICRPDGEVRWVLVQLNPLMRNGVLDQVVGSVLDVTDEHYLTGLLRALVDARSAQGSFFAEALGRIATLLGAEYGCLLLRDSPRDRLRPGVCWRNGQAVTTPTAAECSCPTEELLSEECRIISSRLAMAAPKLAAQWAPGCEAALCQPLPRRNSGNSGYLCLAWRRQLKETVSLRRLAEIVALSLAAELERDSEAEAKRRIEQQLLQSQKFEALGALSAGIAHDFNNVLTAVLNFAELARTAVLTAERERHLDQIVAAGRRASALVRQIMRFQRRPLDGADEERGPLDLRHVVTDALRFLRPAIYSSIRVEFLTGTQPPLIRGDATRMYQVVMNLFVNAAQAIGDRVGRIRLQLDVLPGESPQGLPWGRFVRMAVEDTGPGIPADVLPRVFERSFTTKERSGGSGLGLALVKEIVEGHGGAVTADSGENGGARFVVWLPAIDEVCPPAAEPARQTTVRGAGEHVLLVDDELAVLHACESALLECGFRVSAFTDPAKALASFWADPTQFSAAVIDFRMPGMTGVALTEQLQRVGRQVPVALISGYATEISPECAASCGAMEVLEKPFGPAELTQVVARLLGVRRH